MATTTAVLHPGDVLGGFRVDDVIGIGGMAIVYRAVQVSLGRPVALKVLSSKLTSDTVFRERFRREGMHAASLEHPNIVPVYDSGEEDGHLYLAMRLVEGTNLAELIQTRGVTADQTIEILRPIASALDTAHATGLIHRDVKPQNILITAQGHPYLADFGVAKGSNTSGLTATGGFVGSVNYASPEQIKGLTLTSASDVYALTAVLYQCLTGHVPYPRETDAGVMHAQLTEPPPTLPTITGADSDFHTVLARGMAKDPGARYGHAGDLINAAALSVGRLPAGMRKAVPAFPSDSTAAAQSAPGVAVPAGDPEPREHAQPAKGRAAADLTTADQRRAPAPPTEPQVPKSNRVRQMTAGVLAVVVAVAIALLLISSSGGGVRAATIRRGLIALSYTKPWHEATVTPQASYGLRLENAIGLTDSAAALTAGALANGRSEPGSVPPTLLPRLDKAAQKSNVRLGTVVAVQYDATSKKGAVDISLLVIPTARGDLGLLCSSSSSLGLQSCLKLASEARVLGVQPVPPGPDPSLAKGLSATLDPSAAARAHGAGGLSSSKLSTRASTAEEIAGAESRSARSLGSLAVEPRDASALAALARTLREDASAIGSLANAAKKKDRSGYAKSAAAVSKADRALSSAMSTLRTLGFVHLAAMPYVHIAAYPSPRPRSHVQSTASVAPAATPTQPTAVTEPAPAPAVSAPAPVEHSAPAPSHHSESPQTVVSAPK